MRNRRPSIPPVVGGDWLRERFDEVVLADVRYRLVGGTGRREYLDGHLPGAVWVDLDADLADEPSASEGRHPLPSPEAFAAAMGERGIPHDRPVVAYDQGHGAFAARLVWMLRATGHDAALLDGGFAGWVGPVEVGDHVRPPTHFPASPWPEELLADLDEVARLSREGGAALVDARAAERFRGELEPMDARAGHVPGAINLPFAGNLGDDGFFLPVDRIAARYADAGLSMSDDVVVYCGSGVTACHDVLALELAGIDARLFPGSWSQWAQRADLPVATAGAPA